MCADKFGLFISALASLNFLHHLAEPVAIFFFCRQEFSEGLRELFWAV